MQNTQLGPLDIYALIPSHKEKKYHVYLPNCLIVCVSQILYNCCYFLFSDYSENHYENGDIFEKIIVAGWGKTRYDQTMLTEANGVYVWTPQLKKLNQNYVNTDNCMRISPYSRQHRRLSTETLLCAQGIVGTSLRGILLGRGYGTKDFPKWLNQTV